MGHFRFGTSLIRNFHPISSNYNVHDEDDEGTTFVKRHLSSNCSKFLTKPLDLETIMAEFLLLTPVVVVRPKQRHQP